MLFGLLLVSSSLVWLHQQHLLQSCCLGLRFLMKYDKTKKIPILCHSSHPYPSPHTPPLAAPTLCTARHSPPRAPSFDLSPLPFDACHSDGLHRTLDAELPGVHCRSLVYVCACLRASALVYCAQAQSVQSNYLCLMWSHAFAPYAHLRKAVFKY